MQKRYCYKKSMTHNICGEMMIRVEDVQRLISCQPIACDMGKILNQLEELRAKEYDDSDEEPDLKDTDDIYDDGRSQGRYEAFREAIKIISSGGIEKDGD